MIFDIIYSFHSIVNMHGLLVFSITIQLFFSIFAILIHVSIFYSIILYSHWNILLFSSSCRVLADHAVEVWPDSKAGIDHIDHADAGTS